MKLRAHARRLRRLRTRRHRPLTQEARVWIRGLSWAAVITLLSVGSAVVTFHLAGELLTPAKVALSGFVAALTTATICLWLVSAYENHRPR